jgi:hypothetical protein
MRLVRLVLLIAMAFLALGIVIGIGAKETGPVEKVVLGILLVAVFVAAIPVRRIGAVPSAPH